MEQEEAKNIIASLLASPDTASFAHRPAACHSPKEQKAR
jgi:hypothetical protein